MNFTLLGDRILVLAAEEETTPSGIILLDKTKEKPARGIVKAIGKVIGPRTEFNTFSVEEIDSLLLIDNEVAFNKYDGVPIEIEGTKYLILDHSEVLGIFTNKGN